MGDSSPFADRVHEVEHAHVSAKAAKSAKSIVGVVAVVCVVPLATLACVVLNPPQYLRS